MNGAASPVADAIRALEDARQRPVAPGAPLIAGAVGAMWAPTMAPVLHATGSAATFTGEGAGIPVAEQVPVTGDTIFDLASLTKLFTATLALCEVDAGKLDLAAPVAHYLPDFAAGGKSGVPVRELLTHTSGLQWWLPLWRDWPSQQARVAAVLGHPPGGPRGAFDYSDLNLIALGVLLEKVTGTGLDVLLQERIAQPLGLGATGYASTLAGHRRDQFAATEIQHDTGRGLVQGSVHDENAWSLGGVAGHAGVFSTAPDLVTFLRSFLPEDPQVPQLLSTASRELMTYDHNHALPGDSHGLGFEIDQPRYMGELSGPSTVGHTGFTGTSVVLDLDRRAVAVLLTNAVHPQRGTAPINPLRAAWATGLARSL